MELQRIAATEAPGKPPLASKRDEALQVADGIENIFAKLMVKEMRESRLGGEEDGLFGKGPGSDTYAAWFDNHMAEGLSGKNGIGMKQTIMGYLEYLEQAPTQAQVDAEADKLGLPNKKETIDVRA